MGGWGLFVRNAGGRGEEEEGGQVSFSEERKGKEEGTSHPE